MKKLFLALILTILPINNGIAQIIDQNNHNNQNKAAIVSQTTGISYDKLQELLFQGEWKKANDETLKLLLEATGDEERGWFTNKKLFSNDNSLASVACEDLRIINTLWTQNSNGKFGFSVQYPIYLETGNKPGRMNIEAYQKFGERIGWRKGNDWIIFYENLNFSINAPAGHFPNPRLAYELTGGMLEFSALTKRWSECQQ